MEGLRGRTYLVTGGAGFIGSHLVDGLLANGARVRVIDDLTSGYVANLDQARNDIEFFQYSILDQDALDKAAKGCDGIFHLAAIVSVPVSVNEPIRCHQVNSVGTLCVLEAARKAGAKVVLSSSAAVYGDNEALPLKETEAPRPLSPYGVQKLNNEQYLAAYHELHGMQGFGLRYFNVYGPRQDPKSPYSGVITLFIKAALENAPLKIFGDGEQTRDFIFVSDVVEANVRAMCTPHDAAIAMNIATGIQTELTSLGNEIIAAAGSKSQIEFLPPRAGDIVHSLAHVELAEKTVGFKAKKALHEGLLETVDFFRA